MVILFKRLIKDASGVTAIEYGLISALRTTTDRAAEAIKAEWATLD